jgi:hypothetical protein
MNSRQSLPNRILATLLILFLLLFQFGCATQKSPPLDLHLKLQTRKIALLPACKPPTSSLELFAKNRFEGGVKGAGLGMLQGFQNIGPGSCQGEMCGPVLLLAMALAVVVGGTAGGVAGAIQATPREETQRIEKMIQDSLDDFSGQLGLDQQVLAEVGRREGLPIELLPTDVPVSAQGVPDYQWLQTQGFQSVLSIDLTRIGFIGGEGKDPLMSLQLQALARLIDLDDPGAPYHREFRILSTPRRFSEWAAADAVEVRQTLAANLQMLARDAVSELFEQVDIPIDSYTWAFPGTAKYGCCWLCPQAPANDYSFWGKKLRYPLVESVQPKLAWDIFPDAERLAQIREGTGQEVSNVTYDLRIWNVDQGNPGSLIYDRQGLAKPEYTLDAPLSPSTPYFWSFRACFSIGEGRACTPWAFSLIPSLGTEFCESPTIAPWNYYRFQTP